MLISGLMFEFKSSLRVTLIIRVALLFVEMAPPRPACCRSERYSPAALHTVDRPLGVVLAVLEMGLELVQAQRGDAPEACVVTADLQLGQHVAHDAGDGPQVGQRHHRAVHRADLLLGEPLRDAGIAEGVLTVRGLCGNRDTVKQPKNRNRAP